MTMIHCCSHWLHPTPVATSSRERWLVCGHARRGPATKSGASCVQSRCNHCTLDAQNSVNSSLRNNCNTSSVGSMTDFLDRMGVGVRKLDGDHGPKAFGSAQ
jgi:hypothetical protein